MGPTAGLLAVAAFCSALLAAHARAPNGNCDLLYNGESITESTWDSFLNVSQLVGNLKDDTPAGQVYLPLTTDQVSAVKVDSGSQYIDVNLDTGASMLQLVVNEKFNSYEEDMVSSSDPTTIIIETTITCSDAKSNLFIFRITVEDINNHAPAFEWSEHEYELPMPLPSGIDLSCIIGVITVEDIDITNSAITVEFDQEGAQLLRADATYQGNRQYAVRISSLTAIELTQTTSFTMTAKDNGSPAKSSAPATITIKVDQETSAPAAPKFQQPAVHQAVSAGDIMPGNQIATVTISEGYDTDVKVTHETLDDAGLTPSSDKFSLAVAAGSGAGTATVTLSWADGATSEDLEELKYALIVIQATRDRGLSATQTATMVIHLSLPGMEDPPTTACPTPEPTTQCPEPDPCVCTTETPETTTQCPEPDPCNCTTSTSPAEPTTCPAPETCPTVTPCPDPDPCDCSTSSSTSTSTPDGSGNATTSDSTSESSSQTTEPTQPTTPYPSCDSTDGTEPCICPAPSQCTTVETTSPGSPTNSTESTSSPTSSSTSTGTGSPTESPTSSPTTSDTGSSTGSTECPACPECPTTCPTTSPTSPTGSPTGSTDCPVCPTTCTPCESCPTAVPTTTTELPPGPEIEFEMERYSRTVASDYQGLLLDLRLKDSTAADGYTLDCQLDTADGVAGWLAVDADGSSGCRLSAAVALPAGSYSLGVVASLPGTSSSATAQVALGVSAAVWCNASSSAGFSTALLLAALPEHPAAPQTVAAATQLPAGARCSFSATVDPARYTEWVRVDEATGEVQVVDADYEDVTSLVIWLQVSCDPEDQQQQRRRRASVALPRKDQPDWPRELLYDETKMSVLVQIEDINDHAPVFTAGDRLVVGYPTGDLLERVQPGPVVTLTATDADEGENAELRFSLDAAGAQRFAVQPRSGAVYLRADAAELPAEGAAFTATVADLAGADGARTDSIQVLVKPVQREELVLVTTVQGALPEDADTVVRNLSSATGLAVGLLRAYAAAPSGNRAAPGGARAAAAERAAEGAALTLLLYALDDQEALVTVDDFQTLLSASEVELPWEVSKVENLPPEAQEQEPTDITGYMAAIITLAVLIAVAVVAVGAGYYFYFRPRLGIQKKKDGYTEFKSDADKPSPLESQIPQITTTVEPNVSTVSEIIEPVNKLAVENNIQSNGVLAPSTDDDWPRKRSMTIRGGPDDYDVEAHGGRRRSESSDSLDGVGTQAESEQRKSSVDEDEASAELERRKSTVHFNENVECIEVERL